MNFDPIRLAEMMAALVKRTGNMPDDMRKAAIADELEREWDALTHKVPLYLAGQHLLENNSPDPGYFNLMSLGNWITIAEAANLKCVPARIIGLLDPIIALKCAMNGIAKAMQGLSEAQQKSLIELIQASNSMKRNEILRFDPSASASLKLTLQDQGEPDESCRGLKTNGTFLEPDFSDPRLADNFLWYTDASMPVWARSWIKAKRIPAAISEFMPNIPPSQTRPVEWRLYIRDGAIIAASQYYPHKKISKDAALKEYSLGAALEAGQVILAKLSSLNIIPHHPRYEQRQDLDTGKVHCTLDFLITPEGAPLLLEAGPTHLRNPNWGSHPCNFGVKEPPLGIALGEAERASF